MATIVRARRPSSAIPTPMPSRRMVRRSILTGAAAHRARGSIAGERVRRLSIRMRRRRSMVHLLSMDHRLRLVDRRPLLVVVGVGLCMEGRRLSMRTIFMAGGMVGTEVMAVTGEEDMAVTEVMAVVIGEATVVAGGAEIVGDRLVVCREDLRGYLPSRFAT